MSISLEKRPSVDQAPHRALALLAARPQLFVQQGSIAGSYRSDGAGGRWGPYYRLTYRVDGRQTSIYLGREGPLVAAVRDKLAEIQGPRCRERWYRRVEKETRVSLRACKRELALHLSCRGLTLKGFEVRGWRRLHAPRLPQFRIPTIRLPRLPGIVITQSGRVRLTGLRI